MNDSTTNSLIVDYAKNIKNKEVATISFIQDFLATNPANPDQIDVTYYLYNVKYTDNQEDHYIYVVNESSQMVILADQTIIDEIFTK
jgi:hypothetical protein